MEFFNESPGVRGEAFFDPRGLPEASWLGTRYSLDDDLLLVAKNTGVVLFLGAGVANKLAGVWLSLITGALLLTDTNGEALE